MVTELCSYEKQYNPINPITFIRCFNLLSVEKMHDLEYNELPKHTSVVKIKLG